MAKYRKARAWVGKELSLHLGRGDMKIRDGVDYDDPRLARFVSLGFVVEVKPGPQAAQKPSAPQPQKAPRVPPPAEQPTVAPVAAKEPPPAEQPNEDARPRRARRSRSDGPAE